MSRCETCGNEYHSMLTIRYRGRTHLFDSFECAIHRLAPACGHCGCRIIGHGVESDGQTFCCDHCAQEIASTRAAV